MNTSGEEFLNKLYKDLNLSDEVRHTATGAKDKNEAVARYMERLEKTHGMVSGNKHKLDLLKELYYNKHVVKESDIPRYRDKNRIIEGQKESLDKWLDYLVDENARYPMWAKYWAFQGMLKIGTYDEANGVYQKRSKKTLAPFVEANPEIIAKCIGLVVDHVGGKELDDENLKKLVVSGNFSKLYTNFLSKNKGKSVLSGDVSDGIWITYHQGMADEAENLYNSLQGYNTGWCTAGALGTAKDQICGGRGYVGGDFHVYYTKDENGEYKVPRIAIRMDKNNIGEIKGVAESQNIEDGLEDIIIEKIKNFDGITKENVNRYLKIIHDMKKLTLLNKKNAKKENFTEEDIKFIYELEGKISGFGFVKDPRIKKIKDSRNKTEDVNQLRDRENVIEFLKDLDNFKAVSYSIRNDREIVLEAVKRNGFALKYASDNLKNDREVVLEAMKECGAALRYVSDNLKNDREVVLEAVKDYGGALRDASDNLKNDREFVLEAVKSNGFALKVVSDNLKNDREVVLEAVKNTEYALDCVPENLKNDREFILEAVKNNEVALKYASDNLKNDREVVLEAVKSNVYALIYVPENLKNDRKFILEAVKNNEVALNYAPDNLKNDREFILEAVKQNGMALNYAPEKFRNDKLLKLVVLKSVITKNNVQFISTVKKIGKKISNGFKLGDNKSRTVIKEKNKSR